MVMLAVTPLDSGMGRVIIERDRLGLFEESGLLDPVNVLIGSLVTSNKFTVGIGQSLRCVSCLVAILGDS